MSGFFRNLALSVFGLASVCLASPETAPKKDYRDADVIVSSRTARFEFVSYAGFGGGALFVSGSAAPSIEVAGGFQFSPWFALGGFCAASPLSDFEHARPGISIADVPAAYALSSGAEIIITPLPENLVHPLLRATIGGATLGYLEDIDGKEGYDRTTSERCFAASLSTGAEVNLSRHWRLSMRGGWRWIANTDTLGLEAGAMSGPEVALALRTIWRTTLD